MKRMANSVLVEGWNEIERKLFSPRPQLAGNIIQILSDFSCIRYIIPYKNNVSLPFPLTTDTS